MNLELAHEFGSMAIDGFRTDAQTVGDAAIGQPTGDTLQHLQFASGKILRVDTSGEDFVGACTDDPTSGRDVAEPGTQFVNRCGFQKNSINSKVDQLLQNSSGGAACHHDNSRLWAPAPRLDHHFQPRSAGHDKIKQCAVGSVFLDGCDRFNSIAGGPDDFEIVHGSHRCAGSLDSQSMIIGNQYCRWHSFDSMLRFVYMLAGFILLVTVLSLPTTAVFGAQSAERILDLTSPADPDLVGAHIDFLVDENHEFTLADVIGDHASEFRPIKTRVADFGYTRSALWLRLRLANSTGEIFNGRLYFQENFKQIFHVYIVDGQGRVDHALAQEIDSPFSTRTIAFPELVVPFEASPGDQVTIYVRFWTEGSTNLPLSVETVESFTVTASQKSAKNFVFYGMMLVLIAIALLSMLVLRQAIFPAYIAYAASTLLYIMHSDGVAFQYLWPGFPLFNSVASVVTGSAYVVFGSIYARVFLNTHKYHPLIDKVLLAIIAGTVLLVLSAFVIETSLVKKYLILVALFAVTVFTVAGLVAARQRFREVRFYVLAWLGAAASAAMMTSRHWFGVEISQEFQYDSMRAVMVIDAMLMGMAIIDRYNQLRANHQTALESSLHQAQRNLDMTKRLRDLEARYELVVQNSARRDRQLENTVHDLRQPLHSLRLAVHGAIRGEPDKSDGHADINESFSYLETLVTDHLDQVAGEQCDGGALGEESGIATMSLNDILRSVHEMFIPDAESKGLTFVYVPTSTKVPVEPLEVMRIVTNLVSNAIKYTDEGKVLIGARKMPKGVRVEVHDTGPGLTGDTFAEACRRSVRLAAQQNGPVGHGVGLDIVAELAERCGYTIRFLDRRRAGTGIAVEIPDKSR